MYSVLIGCDNRVTLSSDIARRGPWLYIAILWGTGDKGLIERLRLGPVGPDEFISYKPTDPAEIALLRNAQHID